jgi:hypothetical protein
MGDGPEGPNVSAADLSRLEWQRKTTNERVIQAIVRGKGKMPAFSFEPADLEALVKLLQMMAPRNTPNDALPRVEPSQTNPGNSVVKP